MCEFFFLFSFITSLCSSLRSASLEPQGFLPTDSPLPQPWSDHNHGGNGDDNSSDNNNNNHGGSDNNHGGSDNNHGSGDNNHSMVTTTTTTAQ
jgi:hypothetical protein